MRHMDADLVGTAGFQAQAQTGVDTEMFHNAVMGHRRFPHRVNRHMRALGWVTADWFFNRTASGHVADSHRLILAGNFAQLQ